jgi:hypothetical protein
MCSSTSARLARIYRAIEELERLGAADRRAGAGGSTGADGGADAGKGEGHDVAGSPTALGRSTGAVSESAAGAEGDGVADGGGETRADGDSEADAQGDGRTDADGDNVTDTEGDNVTDAGGGSAPGTDGGNVAAGERAAGADADVASRLAEIWAMIADADPQLAKRLPRYLGPNS